MSISTPFRTICGKFPQSLPNPKTQCFKTLLLSIPQVSPSFTFFRPITIERLPTKPLASSSSSSSPYDTMQSVEELPPKLREIVKLFQAVEDSKAKYEQLLFYAKNLTPLDAQYKTDENKVKGCVSQVWVRAYVESDSKSVVYEADSDSVLTKGLAALLVQGLSGRPIEEILRVSPNFVVLLGLRQSLSPSRNNGFLNMLKLMQRKALQLFAEKENDGDLSKENLVQILNSGPERGSVNGDMEVGVSNDEANIILRSNSIDGFEFENDKDSEVGVTNKEANVNPVSNSINDFELGNDGVLEVGVTNDEADVTLGLNSIDGFGLGNRGKRIKEKLEAELKPFLLEVEDISYQHAGHAGVRGSDGETHFNLKVVSREFEGKSMVKRHRVIYGLLQDELQSGLHALSIVAKTPSEV